jgi:LysR family transcriptional regulator, glycine cleavage system transcriptional activator
MTSLHNDQGLRIVECAARLQSFARAADELGMTRAAVSAQVRGLEEKLGLQLFERRGPMVRPTSAAVALADQLARAYLQVDDALRAARSGDERQRITVSAVPNLASAWLMPRLSRWLSLHPEVDLQLQSSATLSSLALDGVDLALRDGYGDWPGLPALVRHQAAATARWMPKQPLFGLQRRDWLMWMRADGVNESLLEQCRLHTWDCWRLVADAVQQGAGVGLLSAPLYDIALAQGRLRRLGRAVLTLPRAHWVAVRPERLRRPLVRALVDWLRDEAAATEQRVSCWRSDVHPQNSRASFLL